MKSRGQALVFLWSLPRAVHEESRRGAWGRWGRGCICCPFATRASLNRDSRTRGKAWSEFPYGIWCGKARVCGTLTARRQTQTNRSAVVIVRSVATRRKLVDA